ncbi:hypothetical protein L0F63_000701 [Massospora cicadina]|nr:hypothetical protein L0F63_000701 [Massospora cicadina]
MDDTIQNLHQGTVYSDQTHLAEFLNTPPHSPYLDTMLFYPGRANSWDAGYTNIAYQPSYPFPTTYPYPESYQDFIRRSSFMSRGLPRGRAVMLGSMLTRPYQCDHIGCGKMFKRSEHLKRHYRSIHTQDRPFMCQHPNCNKRFSRSDNLAQHMRIHRSPNSPQDTNLPSSHQAPRGRPIIQPELQLPKIQKVEQPNFNF